MKGKFRFILLFSFLAFPVGGQYKLDGYNFGGGGSNEIGSSNYSIQGRIGGINDGMMAGLAFERQANVPKAPTIYNDGSYYNQLKITLDNSSNPSDTKFAIAVSKDNFVTTKYVNFADYTLGDTLTMTSYRSYSDWGGSSGFMLLGLDVGTTYAAKVKAMQGKYSETQYGPVASGSTVISALTFDIDVAETDSETNSPYLISLGDLIPGSIYSSNQKVWVDFETNTTSGGNVYIYGTNGGLYSVTANASIGTTAADLATIGHGFGVQAVNATQTSGGPLSINGLYSGSGEVVGLTDSVVRTIFSSSGAVTGGRASFVVKAKADNSIPAASDYSETLVVVASANY